MIRGSSSQKSAPSRAFQRPCSHIGHRFSGGPASPHPILSQFPPQPVSTGFPLAGFSHNDPATQPFSSQRCPAELQEGQCDCPDARARPVADEMHIEFQPPDSMHRDPVRCRPPDARRQERAHIANALKISSTAKIISAAIQSAATATTVETTARSVRVRNLVRRLQYRRPSPAARQANAEKIGTPGLGI